MEKKIKKMTFSRPATYDLTNPKHVKEIFKNNKRYYFYKKLWLILMDKKNFWNSYSNPEEIFHDETISLEVPKLRTGVIVGAKYPYIFKKVALENCYEFLYLFYYRTLVSDEEFIRSMADVPLGIYTVKIRIKDAESKHFSYTYSIMVDLVADLHVKPKHDKIFSILMLWENILAKINQRFIDWMLYRDRSLNKNNITEKTLNKYGKDAFIMLVLTPYVQDFTNDTLRTVVDLQRESMQTKESWRVVIAKENLRKIECRK